MKPVAVIPARWGSTRFPGKPLALLRGRPLVLHVLEACRSSGAFSDVRVATDDLRIAAVVSAAGAAVERTAANHPSGTDRVAEVAARLPPGVEVVVNVQGDEPLVHPEALRALADAFKDPSVEMATLVRPLRADERSNPHVVKALIDQRSDALYFSRADVPFVRGDSPVERWAHQGLYGYRRTTLLRLAGLAPTPLERAESLEQLRALEHGIPSRCVPTTHLSIGVDTPEDLGRAEALLAGHFTQL
ncbi:MAG TPA: 3-deoxy-manno-octulosonate cytidylyltransferase [Myxococcaceae bacterium]|nr:3-deoxy-manno-octulosonate cytidylyltransferase [Myxococcaceae bacterium]